MSHKFGIIDLGTNTFHLLIVEKNKAGTSTLYRESRPARIGKGGINDGIITAEGIARGMEVLRDFRQKLDEFSIDPEVVFAFGTSALRNAKNRADFCALVRQEVGIAVTIIDGNLEAEYIYFGVRSALNLGDAPSLIVDIGGGSVECIIGNAHQIFWKQSFEVGGQRLMEKFMRTDPIHPADSSKLRNYLGEQLIPLSNAMHQYSPRMMVGSSGTFDTLVDMYQQHRYNEWPSRTQTGFDLPKPEFYRMYELLLTKNKGERLALPGMIELRVDMIVVAVLLVDFLLKTFPIETIRVSSYSLKEGALDRILASH